MKQLNRSLSPHMRHCVRFYGGRWGVDTPAKEHAVFGHVSQHFRPGAPVRKWHYDKGSYVAVHESSVFRQFFMYDAQNMAVCKTALNRCGAMVQSCFLCCRENSSQIVV